MKKTNQSSMSIIKSSLTGVGVLFCILLLSACGGGSSGGGSGGGSSSSIPNPPELSASSSTLIFGVNVAGSSAIAGSGGAPIRCSVVEELPDGLRVSVLGNGCAISGTAAAESAQSTYTLSASNQGGLSTITVTLGVIASPILVTPDDTLVFGLNVASSSTIENTGGVPTRCNIAGLPNGLDAFISGNGCTISGTATTISAQTDHTLSASNQAGTSTVTFSLRVVAPPELTTPSAAFVFAVGLTSSSIITGSGGTPVSCSVAGLPDGLETSFSDDGCAISGTATTISAQTDYTLSASNQAGTSTVTFSLRVIAPPLLITPSSPLIFGVDVEGGSVILGIGGVPISCSTVEALPIGLSASVSDTGCAISGTATTETAQSDYTLVATNQDGTSTVMFSLSVVTSPVLIQPDALIFGINVTNSITIIGRGSTPTTCSVAGLPTGLNASVLGSGCAIGGAATTATAQSDYTLIAANQDGTSTIVISLGVVVPPDLSASGDTLLFGVNVAGSSTITGTNGVPASCAITGLPTGLIVSVSGNGCVISGTATAESAPSSYTLTASNPAGVSTVVLSLSVVIPPMLEAPSDGLIFAVGVTSSSIITGSGGPSVSCSVAGLPAGLSASASGDGCTISGTATAESAPSSYTLIASNPAGISTVVLSLSVVVPPVLIIPSDELIFTVDLSSSRVIVGSGGAPISCSVMGLPTGLNVSVLGDGCAISGTATIEAMQSSYTLIASNPAGVSTITFFLSAVALPVLVKPNNALIFGVNVTGSMTISGSGGAPTVCSTAEELPSGLNVSVSGRGCAISGTAAAQSAQRDYVLEAMNQVGISTTMISLGVVVPPVLTTPSSALIFAANLGSSSIIAGSAGTPTTCSIAEALPAGLRVSVSGRGCAISGTALAASAQSSYALSANNQAGTATIQIDLGVIMPPVLTAPNQPLLFGVDLAGSIAIVGRGGAPTACSIAETLPAGLSVSVSGNGCAISGTAVAISAQSSYTLTAVNQDGTGTISIALSVVIPVDSDGDGLIDIYTLTQLHNMRYNLGGSSYKTHATDFDNAVGCPNNRCLGYELMNDLDFDTNGDGSWTRDSSGNYTLDSADSASPYFVVDESGAGGWQPIGSEGTPFNAIFDGKGYIIRHLAIRRNLSNIGFFGDIQSNSRIRNVGLVNNLSEYTGNSNDVVRVGGIAGWQEGGDIIASYATGDVIDGNSARSNVGGLVGNQLRGNIIASYATGNVYGGGGTNDVVGGLVGQQQGDNIIASYATGNADGGSGDLDRAGGLVGYQFSGSIIASYATGNADGGSGASDRAGTLTSQSRSGSRLSASYAFGSRSGERLGHNGTGLPAGVTSAADLTADNVSSVWNSAAERTLGVWNFGNSAQNPAVVFSDYDGSGSGTDYATLFAGFTTLTALISNQRASTAPQIGTAATDIQLSSTDTANHISGDIQLPAVFNSMSITWSVFYDSAPAAEQVSVDSNNLVQVNQAHRNTTRVIIVRAEDSSGNIINDYHLRIIAE